MSRMLDKLNEANKAAPLDVSDGGPDVTDEELRRAPLGCLVMAVQTKPGTPKPGDTKPPEPMERWHLLAEGRKDLVARTLTGRAAIRRAIRFHASNLGLLFQPQPAELVDERTGEVYPAKPVRTPLGYGSWTLVDATGAPSAIFMELAIDVTRGAAAGKGLAFAYHVRDVRGLRLAQARAVWPTLPTINLAGEVLALPYDDAEAAVDAEPESDRSTVTVEAEEPAKAPARRARR